MHKGKDLIYSFRINQFMKKIEIILLLFFLTSCSLKNKENKEINQIKLNKISIEDTSCRVSVRQINKRCYYDTVIICIYPTKAELEQFKYKPEFIQNKNKEFINALNFLVLFEGLRMRLRNLKPRHLNMFRMI